MPFGCASDPTFCEPKRLRSRQLPSSSGNRPRCSKSGRCRRCHACVTRVRSAGKHDFHGACWYDPFRRTSGVVIQTANDAFIPGSSSAHSPRASIGRARGLSRWRRREHASVSASGRSGVRRVSHFTTSKRSTLEFKASVLGAYERGERAISVPRLLRLAEIYEVPADQLLPRDFDGEISLVESAGGSMDQSGHVRDRPRTPARRRRSRRADHLEIRVVDTARAPGLQRSHAHDPTVRPAGARGVHGSKPRRSRRPARAARPAPSPQTVRVRLRTSRATLNPPWQRLERPARLRPPPSRSWFRATTSWWVCWVNATSYCA